MRILLLLCSVLNCCIGCWDSSLKDVRSTIFGNTNMIEECADASKTTCSDLNLKDKISCQRNLKTRLERCSLLFNHKTFEQALLDQQNKLWISVRDKIETEKGPLLASLLSDKENNARIKKHVDQYIKLIEPARYSLVECIELHASYVESNRSKKEFLKGLVLEISKEQNVDLSAIVGKVNGILRDDRYLFTELKIRSEFAKSEINILTEFYRKHLSPLREYMNEKELRDVDNGFVMVEILESILASATDNMNDIEYLSTNIIEKLFMMMRQQSYTKSMNETKESLEPASFLQASTQFLSSVNKMTEGIWDDPITLSNNYPDLFSKYKDVKKILNMKGICLDKNESISAWKQAGCKLLERHWSGLETYVEDILAPELKKNLRAMAKEAVEDENRRKMIEEGLLDLKNANFDESLYIYNKLVR